MKINKIGNKALEIIDYDYKSDIRDYFYDYGVICIRNNEDVSMETLIKLAEMFGNVHRDPTVPSNVMADDDYKVQRISNKIDDAGAPIGALGDLEIPWHCDYSHNVGEYHGSILYNHYGGDLAKTSYVNQQLAVEMLPKEQIEYLKDAIGEHRLSQTKNEVDHNSYYEGRVYTETVKRPVLFRHPVTNKICLYISPATFHGCNKKIDIRQLCKDTIKKSNLYIHKWQPFDCLLQDNIQTMHRRTGFAGERVMYRIQFDYSLHRQTNWPEH
jgi:alpha-ketoglutarate-dependent taurine dioxygenase